MTLKSKLFPTNFLLSLLMMAGLVAFTSCDDGEDDLDGMEEEVTTLADLLAETPELSTLNSILTSSDYDFSAVLDIATDAEARPVTVFAPTNDAFTTFLDGAALADIPAADVEALVSYHILTGSFPSTSLTAGKVATLEGSEMFINPGDGVVINGQSEVTTPDIVADNGVVHIVDAVIAIPDDIVTTAVDMGFASLAAALTQVTDDANQADLIGTLSGTGPFTVFAPTDVAFTNFLDGAALADIPNDLLETVLTYHVVDAEVFSTDLEPGTVTTLEGTDFTVNIDGSVTIDDEAGNTVTVTMTDILCSNGVIHVIDGVIDPRTP